ncbi:hypothetical protein GYA13_00825 [Candidatus Kuenenbacteria bacterium]|nr:hypothetical protein [Candidatus Kuenenbacteria bacterium]
MMNVTQTIPKGYKKTEIGVIPEDWEIKKLGELADYKNGKSLERYIDNSGDYYLMTLNSLDINGRLKEDHLRVKFSDNSLSKNDLIMILSDVAHGNFLGLTDLIPESNRYVLNQRVGALRNVRNVSPYFLSKYINCHQKYFKTAGQGSSQLNLSKGDVLDFLVAYPTSKSEQSAISDAITDIDLLISKTRSLIEKKKNIKQGAMQELLSGKRRLSGFKGKWNTQTLGEIADFERGQGLSKADLNDAGAYRCIHYGQLFTGYKELIGEIKSKTNVAGNHFYSKANDVLMPTSDVTPRGLATASCIREDGVVLGGGILVIRLHSGHDGVFLSYFITQNKNSVLKLVKGSTVFHLYANDLANLEVSFPEFEEQKAIAQILTDMESEIEKLESQLTKYQDIKQGMMQTLLTGKIILK